MEAGRREEGQVPLLLRVGLGAVWLYEGLVPTLLVPNPELLALVRRLQPLPTDPIILLQALAAFKILLGLLLIRGWMVRSVAALQCGLLLLSSLGIGVLAPRYLVYPTGAIAKTFALFAAGLCLLLLGGGDRASARRSWSAGAVPLILRVGLGFMWLYEGIVPKWVAPSPAEVEIVARTALVPSHIPLFLRFLGGAEAALGLLLLIGLWVRGLAVFQVGLLTAFTAIIGWTSPGYLWDPLGTLSKNLGLMGGALALYRTGSGSWGLDASLTRSAAWRRLLFLARLQWTLVTAVGAAEVYRMQTQGAAGPNLQGLLEKLGMDDANHGNDLRSLIRRHGGRPIPVTGLSRGVGRIVGALTVILGPRASLRFDLWLEELGASLYGRSAGVLPPEAGITARALQAMHHQKAQHIRLLRDHLRAMRAPAGRRRR